MNNHGLDLHCEMMLEEYRENLHTFHKMKEIVDKQIRHCLRSNKIKVNAVESRIKTEKSLIGKLERKGHKYRMLSDITDILGARIITFYTDEVDKVSALIDNIFEIDWEESVDKRKILDLDRFGYQSLHYICRIPPSLFSSPDYPMLNEFRFEIQMRTALQHVWATMNHDTGYKSGVEIPKEHLRNLNCIAGMLELADEQFSHIRREINDYRRNVQSLVASGNFDDVPLNGDTFRSYLALDPYRALITRIADINQAEVYKDNFIRYLDVLLKMGFTTLGSLDRLKKECAEGAYQLALHQFAGTDLDILAYSVALQNLCIVHLINHDGSVHGLQQFFMMLGDTAESSRLRAQRTLEQAEKIHLI